MTGCVSLLDLDFADLSVAQAAERIAARPPGCRFGYVVTPNADHLVRVAHDPALKAIYREAWSCLLDSRVVQRLARLFGLATPAVCTGSDLTECLLAHHVRPQERITIIGLDPVGVGVLMQRYGLVAPAHYDPPMGLDRNPQAIAAAVDFVTAHPARFVFLAVGSPRQERLAAAIAASKSATGTALCIGASLEFLSGARRRAPETVQHAGLEWLFRLASDPRRLMRRYLVNNPRIVTLLWRQRRSVARDASEPLA